MTQAIIHVQERGRGLTRWSTGCATVRKAVQQAQALRRTGAKVSIEIVKPEEGGKEE